MARLKTQIVCCVTSAAMSTQDQFVTAARECLSVGRKCLSLPQSVDLAAQVLAVNLGLKPALLYDSNGARADQVQQYLSALHSSQLVSKLLYTLDLNGNVLIVNSNAVRSNLEQVFHDGRVAVIDVCHHLEKPKATDGLSGELRTMMEDLLHLLRRLQQLEADKPLYVGERSEEWNLCTVFGLLLGYPATYWFDQTKSFENCLAMTPLVVTTASASWRAQPPDHDGCRLYSFSVPAALLQEVRPILEKWKLGLQERFQQQNVLKDLIVCETTVTLPSVCL